MTEAADEPTVHAEPARSYASVAVLAGVLLVGVVVDAVLGGAAAHAIGWLVAFALVLGVQALFVYAARSTRSLTVTDTQIRVGDETVQRTEVVGVVVDDDAPVLGWPNGMPRKQGLTVGLVDNRSLTIPTRDPGTLQRVLGLDPAPSGPPPVRAADAADLLSLAEIDERAEVVFRLAGYDLPDVPFADDLDDARAVFVVGDPPVGFVRVDEVDGLAHIVEIAVLPGAMRRGHGGRLLEYACDWARANGYPAVTLTTYADVPWNGPWYARCGFVEIDPGSSQLQAIRRHEVELGLDAVGRRVAMRREL